MTRTWPGSPRSLRSLGDVLAALLFFSSVVACSEKPKPAPVSAQAEAATVDPDASLTTSEKIALAKLPGAGTANDDVTAAQKAARDNPNVAHSRDTLASPAAVMRLTAWTSRAR